MEKRTIFRKVEPLSMRFLVAVSILAMLVQSMTLLYVTLREQRTVNITVVTK